MTTHTSATQRYDAPTIAFDRQPTLSVPAQALARELFERSTSSTLRPVGLPSREVPTVTTRSRANGKGIAWLCVVCLFIGIGAGHAVRERDSYAAAVSAATMSLTSSSPARGRRTSEILSARALSSSSRAKDVALSSKVEARTPRKSGRAVVAAPARPVVLSPVDALFIDFEPTFRAPR